MRQRLRALRVGVAALVGCLFALVFLGPLVAPWCSPPVWLPRWQLGPALYRLLGGAGLASAALVVAVVGLLTVLAGRVYCAACCPLGILQDAIRLLARRVPALRRCQERSALAQARQPQRRLVLRWAVLAATAVLAMFGCTTLALLLEPYSACGRIAIELAGPLLRIGQDALSSGMERLDIYALAVSLPPRTPAAVLCSTGLFLLLLACMAALSGRLYCTTVCPLGTCLGLLAQAAPLRIRAEPSACVGCGVCARRCRAGCIRNDGDRIEVDQAACVACMDCLAVCTAKTVRYGLPARPAAAAPPQAEADRAGRRELLAAGVATALVTFAWPGCGRESSADTDESTAGPVSPPGSGSREHYVRTCSACQLCVGVCPTRVLKPAFLEYGAAGLLQPRLSYQDGFCEYGCNRCTTVCPTGALQRLDLAEKQRTQLGVARLYTSRCIVYARREECGACAEVCPTHAVYTRERDGLLYPEMAAGACIGCGACEHACPTSPKAIEVRASAVHGRAAPPYVPESATPAVTDPALPAASPRPDFPF